MNGVKVQHALSQPIRAIVLFTMNTIADDKVVDINFYMVANMDNTGGKQWLPSEMLSHQVIKENCIC